MSRPDDHAALRDHVHGFLTALGERPEELLATKLATLRQPAPQDIADLGRYIRDLKSVFAEGLLDMYRRIDWHGRAICELTDDPEIIDRVRQLMALVAQDGADVPKIMASFSEAARELNPFTLVRLTTTIQSVSLAGLPRQVRRDELLLDFSAYCLTRFPPPNAE